MKCPWGIFQWLKSAWKIISAFMKMSFLKNNQWKKNLSIFPPSCCIIHRKKIRISCNVRGRIHANLQSGELITIAVRHINWEYNNYNNKIQTISTTFSNNSEDILCSLMWLHILPIWLQSIKGDFRGITLLLFLQRTSHYNSLPI